MKRLSMIIMLAAALLLALPAAAQNQVKWRTQVKMTTETEGTLTVTAIPLQGWHLYGTKLPKGGPKPTVLDLSASKGVKFLGDFKPSVKPVEKKDEMFGLTLNWWNQRVSFTRRFKLTGAKANAVISGRITYMACNDENCTPPRTENITLKIK